MERLNQSYRGAPFEILAIDVGESKETVRKFIAEKGLSLTVLLDETGSTGTAYGVRSHPMKFLVNPSGEIVAYAMGYREWDSAPMKALIDKVIAKGG